MYHIISDFKYTTVHANIRTDTYCFLWLQNRLSLCGRTLCIQRPKLRSSHYTTLFLKNTSVEFHSTQTNSNHV